MVIVLTERCLNFLQKHDNAASAHQAQPSGHSVNTTVTVTVENTESHHNETPIVSNISFINANFNSQDEAMGTVTMA